MSQLCATSRFPVPNILPGSMGMGDHGTLVIKAGAKWFIWTGLEWHPDKTGLTTNQFYHHTRTRPPCNVEDGWAGIFPCNLYQQNWTRKDVKAAFDIFMTEHAHEYKQPDGNCFDPLKKARILKRAEGQAKRAEINRDNCMIFEAPAPMATSRRVRMQSRPND